MSMVLSSLIINTSDLKKMVEFYRTLGIPLEVKSVSICTEVYRGHLADLEFALYGVAELNHRIQPAFQLCFQVDNLEEVIRRIQQLHYSMVLLDPTEMPDGRRAIVLDPDGHSIELLERKKETVSE